MAYWPSTASDDNYGDNNTSPVVVVFVCTGRVIFDVRDFHKVPVDVLALIPEEPADEHWLKDWLKHLRANVRRLDRLDIRPARRMQDALPFWTSGFV